MKRGTSLFRIQKGRGRTGVVTEVNGDKVTVMVHATYDELIFKVSKEYRVGQRVELVLNGGHLTIKEVK